MKSHRSLGTASNNEMMDGWIDPMLSTRLVSISSDGKLHSYSKVQYPRLLTSVQGESNLLSEAFCCLYVDADDNSRKHRYSVSKAHALCLSSSESSSSLDGASFRNVTLDSHESGLVWDKRAESSRAYNGSWYYYCVWQHFERRADHYKENLVMEIYKLNPATMVLTSITNATVSDNPRQHRDMFADCNKYCRIGYFKCDETS